MKHQSVLSLELGSHPLRNRRLFFLSLFLLVVLFVSVSVVSANLYMKFKNKYDEIQLKIKDVEQKRGRAQLEEIKLADQIESRAATDLSKIDFINSLIHLKSFSWINFLSDLESALPARCYIVSLAPSARGESGMEVKIRVASPTLEDLLKLYTQLVKLGFENVLIRSEEQTNNGQILSEVSFIYEKHI
jgi:Tfp pilus assembly protein PilN